MAPENEADDTDVADEDPASGEDCLTIDELRSALAALTDADLKRLGLAGAFLTMGISTTAEELVCEAVFAAYEGRRRCPRRVPLIVFLKNIMRSLASAAKKAASKLVLYPVEPGRSGNPIDIAPATSADPEKALLEREDEEEADRRDLAAKAAARILNDYFADDYEVQLCLAGMQDGLAGRELREFVGVDQAHLDYARKRIARARIKLFPKGWRHAQD